MQRAKLSLRALEVFLLVAKSGSVQKTASESGLSISTVSHHLRNIEDSVGVGLVDHSRRPMVLTPAGSIFARYAEEGLGLIRRGATELVSGNLAEVRELRLGNLDDFDSEVAPELVQLLARAMPQCTFKHHTRPSHEIIRLLFENKLDAGVATRPATDATGLVEYPLLRDPFIVAIPSSSTQPPENFLNGQSDIPFLRYARTQTIGKLIEAHFQRIKVSLPNRFELESNQSIMGMVAGGNGWTVTTPASFARASRFHGQIALYPLPRKGFTRTLSLYTLDAYPVNMAEMMAKLLRQLIARYFVEPVTQSHVWLTDDFRILPGNG